MGEIPQIPKTVSIFILMGKKNVPWGKVAFLTFG